MPEVKSERWKYFWLENEPKLLMFWYYLWHQKRSERQKSVLTFDVLFAVLIFDVLINLFIFDILIIQKILSTFWPFDVLIFDILSPSLKNHPFKTSFKQERVRTSKIRMSKVQKLIKNLKRIRTSKVKLDFRCSDLFWQLR